MQKIAIDAGGKFDPYSFKTGVNEGPRPVPSLKCLQWLSTCSLESLLSQQFTASKTSRPLCQHVSNFRSKINLSFRRFCNHADVSATEQVNE